MRDIEPAEWAAKFAEMSDEGLAELLAEGRESFEGLAWNALTAEARKRGISEPPASAPESPKPEMDTGTEIFSTYDPVEAEIIRGFLETNGIEVLSYGEDMTNPTPLPLAHSEGIRLLVSRSDFERAGSLIRECQASSEKDPEKA